MVLGELPELPHLPELPARGPGADMIGRSAGLLVELPVEVYAGRWRVAPRPGRDLRRARDLMERDLDQLAEQAEEYAGPIKVQAAGPLTLAASLELPIGGRLLRDPGAVRDLTGSLAEGLRAHVAAVRPTAAPGVGAAPAGRAVAADRAGRAGADRERAWRVPGGRPGGRRRSAAHGRRGGRGADAGALLRPGRAAGADPLRPAPSRSPSTSTWSPNWTRWARRSTPASGCWPGPHRPGRRRPVARRPPRRSPIGYARSGTASASLVASWPSRWWSPRPAVSPAPLRSTRARCSPPAGTPVGGSPRTEVSCRTRWAG